MKRQVRVILLDDEPIVCERLKPALEKIGFYVEAYTESQKVIDRVSEEKFDVLVTDLKMQKPDGLDVMNFVKQQSPATKVIIITGFATQETAAEAILVSSLYGMAEFDLEGFQGKCVEAGLGDVLLYLGGNLAVGRHEFQDDEQKFKAMGFDRVYPPEVDLAVVVADLRNDLEAKGKI